MGSNGALLIAALAFVGTHFLLSHPLRAALVGALGERGFLGVYSLVSLATFVWLVLAYRAAPTTAAAWAVGTGIWATVTVVMLLASVLFVGSFAANPAFPNPRAGTAALPEARGVFAVTRHPMMWAFALWGLCHIAVYPVTKNIIVAGAIVVLALVGAALQDGKKARLQPALWPAWQARTSFLPFAALGQGRARLGSLGVTAWLGGLALWLLATWYHGPLSGWRAGIWHWIAPTS